MRIASLLPSATEIVCALGLGDDLVGVTHACDYPPEIAGKPVLTRPMAGVAGLRRRGSFELDLDALAAARPDLILAQEHDAGLAERHLRGGEAVREINPDFTVLSLEPTSIEGIFHTISTVGAMTEAEDAAVELLEDLRERLSRVERRVEERRDAGHRPPRVVGLEWFDPPYASGHWVPEQVRRAGGWELLGREGEPSVETSWEAVRDVDPEMLILMAGGYHVREAVGEWARAPRPSFWRDLDAVSRGQVFVVDGAAYFSRPGPRVIAGIEMLAEIFDPEAFEEQAPAGSWTPVS